MTVANYILNVVNEYIDYALRISDNIENSKHQNLILKQQ